MKWTLWLWTSNIAEMFGSLASRLSLARMPSCTFQAAATLLPGSHHLLPSVACLFSTSSLSMSDSGGRWWADRIANKKRRRWYLNFLLQRMTILTFRRYLNVLQMHHDPIFCSHGYHDQVKQEGPLPRVRDDSARITQVTFLPDVIYIYIEFAALIIEKYSIFNLLTPLGKPP